MTAARAALRRKKQHEHTLEQTTAQMATLEQQIYSIEAANINKETLLAMENAQKAMASIHDKLDINKVDETMYGSFWEWMCHMGNTDIFITGTNSENSMHWAKRSRKLLLALLLASLSMNQSWMTSWPSLNRSNLTTKCSRQVLFQWPTRSTNCLRP